MNTDPESLSVLFKLWIKDLSCLIHILLHSLQLVEMKFSSARFEVLLRLVTFQRPPQSSRQVAAERTYF